MIRHSKHWNPGAVNALNWLCCVETMREILDAMTPQQLVVAALLVDGMTLKQIGVELDITFQAVEHRRKAAQNRVARSVPPELMGDVLSRGQRLLGDTRRNAARCNDCGAPIWKMKGRHRCRLCGTIERERKRREEA